MSRVECVIGRHRHPIAVFGLNEQKPNAMTRVSAGFRCRCGALVTQKQTSWRSSKRGLKREIAKR